MIIGEGEILIIALIGCFICSLVAFLLGGAMGTGHSTNENERLKQQVKELKWELHKRKELRGKNDKRR